METWMFLSAANWCNKLPPTAINCAESTRMRLSVKRAFSCSVSKKERFFEYKNDSVGNLAFLRLFGRPQLQANTGFVTASGQSEMFVSPGRFSAQNRLISRRKTASNSLRGAKSRRDCCSHRSKGASLKGRLSFGCRKRFPAHSESADSALRAPNRLRRSVA